MTRDVRQGFCFLEKQQINHMAVMKKDISDLKNDWLRDNVRNALKEYPRTCTDWWTGHSILGRVGLSIELSFLNRCLILLCDRYLEKEYLSEFKNSKIQLIRPALVELLKPYSNNSAVELRVSNS